MKTLLRPLILVSCLASIYSAPGAASVPSATSRVPAGFEALLEGQSEQVDVRIYGRSLGLFPAKVSLDTLQFEDVDGVVEALGIDAEKHAEILAQVRQALQAALPRNGNLMCQGSASGCGQVETNGAAIIFDESQGAVNLFLARPWVEALPQDGKQNLFHSIAGRAENALIHRQSMNLTAGRDSRNLSVAGAGALGVTAQGHIAGDWTFVRNEQRRYSTNAFQQNNLYFRQDIGSTFYAQAGRMDQRNLSSSIGGNFGFNMLPLPRFDGVRVGTTQAYVNNGAVQAGTPVTVLLTRSARIDVYRGNELLGTQYLNSGVQTLNSSSFPEGSYPLTLRIFEDGVLRRTENMPFSKTGGGMGTGKTQWFVQGGRVVANSSGARDKAVSQAVQAGVRTGILENLIVTSGVAAIGGHAYNETKLDWQQTFSFGSLAASASVFAGNDGTRGNSQQLSFTNGVSANVYRYQRRDAACGNAGARGANIGCGDSISANVGFPIGDWSVSTGYTYSKNMGQQLFDRLDGSQEGMPVVSQGNARRANDQVSRAVQVGASRSFQWGKANLSTRVGVYRNTSSDKNRPTDVGVYVGLSITGSAPAPTPGESSSYSSAGTDVRTSRHDKAQVGYNASHNWMWQNGTYRELGVDASGYRDESVSGAVRGRMEGRMGSVYGTVSNTYQRSEGRNNPSVTGSYNSSVAVSKSGVFWGTSNGAGEPGAAVAVKVEASDEDSNDVATEVSTANNRPVKLQYGQQALLPIDGYQLARTDVRDATSANAAGSVNVAKGAGTSEYFLTPGKLMMHEVSADTVYTYVGRVLSAAGEPLAGASVLNDRQPKTDEDGGFLLDLKKRTPVLYLSHEGQLLQCPMKAQSKRDVIQLIGETSCSVMPESDLPEDMRVRHKIAAQGAGAQKAS